jgi:cellulose synthase/poly-beta-1,6-N-acetylglucosamine synthase-like glycosyltransferase
MGPPSSGACHGHDHDEPARFPPRAGGLIVFLYAFLAYPALLWVAGQFTRTRRPQPQGSAAEDLPEVSISLPVFNEEGQVASLIRNLLDLEYPSHRRQILIISDASTDSTDEIVKGFASQGVELLRLEERGGKGIGENAAIPLLRGEIVVNTDASIRFPSGTLKKLVSAFADPPWAWLRAGTLAWESEGWKETRATLGNPGMWATRWPSGPSRPRCLGSWALRGCCYAIRRELHAIEVPGHLSRDFAAALNTWERGYRPISVPEAICWVPRTSSIRSEYHRKVRTITRGMETLRFKKSLLNPLRFPVAAWMLLSHKIFRWALPWAAMLALLGLAVLAFSYPWAAGILALSTLFLALGWAGWAADGKRPVPRLLSIPAFVMVGNLAAAMAFLRFLRGVQVPIWEPTRRRGT